MTRSVLAVLLLFLAVPAYADPSDPIPAGIRPMRAWIADLITSARPLSPTLDGQLRRVASLPLIVYIDDLSDSAAPYDGRLSFVGAGHRHRFLRIELRHLSTVTSAAVLAHELQHVLEVAASSVRSRPDFEALYRSVGTEMPRSGGALYDTEAAGASGRAAMRELAIYARTTRAQ